MAINYFGILVRGSTSSIFLTLCIQELGLGGTELRLQITLTGERAAERITQYQALQIGNHIMQGLYALTSYMLLRPIFLLKLVILTPVRGNRMSSLARSVY